MITIYAGIVDIDNDGKFSVRDDTFHQYVIPAVSSYNMEGVQHWFSETNNKIARGILFATDGSVRFDAQPWSLARIVADFGYSSLEDYRTSGDTIGIFTSNDIATYTGTDILHTDSRIMLYNRRYGLLMDMQTTTFSSTFSDYFSDVESNRTEKCCLVIPPWYATATDFLSLIKLAVKRAVALENDGYDYFGYDVRIAPLITHAAIDLVFSDGSYSYARPNDGWQYGNSFGFSGWGNNSVWGLKNMDCWHCFLLGKQALEKPITIELNSATKGLSNIELAQPVYIAGVDSNTDAFIFSIDEGKENDNTFNNQEHLTYCYRYVTPGTNLGYFFNIGTAAEETVSLKTGNLIKSNDTVSFLGINWNGLCFSFSIDGSNFRVVTQNPLGFGGTNEYAFSFWLCVHPDWVDFSSEYASIPFAEWLENIPSSYSEYEYGNCPIFFATSINRAQSYLFYYYNMMETNFTDYEYYNFSVALTLDCSVQDVGSGQSCGANVPFYASLDYDFWEAFIGIMKEAENEPTPYNPGEGSQGGGYSGTGGGQGTYDDTGDDVTHAEPTADLHDNVFKIYNGNIAQLGAIYDYIYLQPEGTATKLNNAVLTAKIFSLPTGAAFDRNENTTSVLIAGENTQIPMHRVNSQFVKKNSLCNIFLGTFKIEEYFGTFLDYTDTFIDIFLPYAGQFRLDTKEVMAKDCSLDCTIDVLVGDIIYTLTVDGSVLYTWAGNVSYDVPVTAIDYIGKTQAYLNMVGSLAAGAVGMVMASTPLGAAVAGGAALASLYVNSLNYKKAEKPNVSRASGISGLNGNMSIRRPYLIITRPKQNIPETFAHEYGFKSHISARLGDLTGFTKVEDIHLENMGDITQDELEELESILKSGVIL